MVVKNKQISNTKCGFRFICQCFICFHVTEHNQSAQHGCINHIHKPLVAYTSNSARCSFGKIFNCNPIYALLKIHQNKDTFIFGARRITKPCKNSFSTSFETQCLLSCHLGLVWSLPHQAAVMDEMDLPQMKKEVESLKYQLAFKREKSSKTVTEWVGSFVLHSVIVSAPTHMFYAVAPYHNPKDNNDSFYFWYFISSNIVHKNSNIILLLHNFFTWFSLVSHGIEMFNM